MNSFDRLRGRGILLTSITVALSLPSYLTLAEAVESREGQVEVEQKFEVAASEAEEKLVDDEAELEVEPMPPSPPQFTELQALRDFDYDLVDFTPAPARSYKQSFKDEVLSFCISSAYHRVAEVKEDALYTAAALHSWSRYEYDEVMDKISPLVSEYLAKPYRHEEEIDEEVEALEVTPQPQPKLSLLKCLDLYHSPALEKLAIDYVIDPERSYAEDHSHIP